MTRAKALEDSDLRREAGTEIKSFHDLIFLAGSTTKLAAALNVHAYTVENWKTRGIPFKYWDALIRLYQLTPTELFAASTVNKNGEPLDEKIIEKQKKTFTKKLSSPKPFRKTLKK